MGFTPRDSIAGMSDVAVRQEATAERDERSRPDRFFNRELSWLDFNDRVLQLAEDDATPLLERLKFCAIWSSNLDEFFMVRVAGLHDVVEAGIDAPGKDGLNAAETLARIREVVSGQQTRLGHCLHRTLLPALRERKICIL